MVIGVEKEVEKLQNNFEAIQIQCVVQDAEERQIEDKSVSRWLARLKEDAYDMENTAILKYLASY